jgi:beta-glucosidase
LTETYLPAFKALVDCGVSGIMGAYNRTNGEPCCGSPTLLRSLLIDTWGFDGYITSDCWAIADFHLYHKVTSSETESIALALENGCVLNCGSIYSHLKEAYQEGLVSESMIRDAAEKVLAIRCALGMFEEHIPFDDIEYTVVDCEQHRRLNLEVARKSLVLLRNDGLLPLRIQHVKHLAVVGPNANSIRALEGNYHGTANQYHTVLESIRTSFSDARVTYSVGAHLHDDKLEDPGYVGDRLGEVKTHIAMADAVILVVGLDESIESEDKGKGKPGFSGDKEDLLLPKSQRLLVETVMAQGKPVIIICMSGSALDLEKGNCANAIIQAWYPGAMGGVAIADLICGRFSPSGRLPVTFYRNSNELPPFEDYSMDNRTYKFFSGEPLYPFGFGLSYTRFEYSGMVLEQDTLNPGEDLHGNLTIANVGDYDGDEIVQFYLRDLDATVRIPHHALCGMQRVSLKRGEHKMIDFTIAGCMFQVTDTDGFTRYERGEFMLFAGPGQPDRYSTVLRHQACQSVRLRLL